MQGTLAAAAARAAGRPATGSRLPITATGCTTTCFHNAWAHYGVRDQRYKLIFWYNDALDQPGASQSDEPPEWELFDCGKIRSS